MSINDFLPIADAPGANVQLQAAYAANPNRTAFYADGAVPDADEHGKMFRQCSVVASQFMQMLADYSGLDMLDDGNLAVLLANMKTQFRIRLLADTTFYIATAGNGGNDANNGTVGSPWLTIQHAVDVVSLFYDLNGKKITFQVGPGTYAVQQINIGGFVGSFNGASAITFKGDSVTPGNVVINGVVYCFNVAGVAVVVIDGFALSTSGAGGASISSAQGAAVSYKNIAFGAASNVNVSGSFAGQISNGGNFSISGNSGYFASSSRGGLVQFSAGTATLIGTPGFVTTFVQAERGANVEVGGIVFAGTGATGSRYFANLCGNITAGGVTFPGSSAGSTAAGGNYQP